MKKTPEEIIKQIEKCVYHESNFNENGIIYACELDDYICRLVNKDYCGNYKEKSGQIE